MAVAFDGSNISQAETETDGGTWDKWGATQSPSQETDFVIQNTYSLSNKISNSTGGVDFDATTPIDYSTTPRIVMARVMTSVPGVIDTTVEEGMSYQIGSGPSAYYNYYLFGSRKDHPLDQSWLSLVIDPNIVAHRDATTGSPSLTAVDYYGLYIDTSGTVKAENIIHDTLNYVNVGKGLTWTSTGGEFQDFVDYDEGTQNNRQGVVTTKGKAIFCYATLTIGASGTATTFTDSNKQIFYPDGLYDAGTVGLALDIQNASSVVTISDSVFVGEGSGALVWDFSTATDVKGGGEYIDNNPGGFKTGDYIQYSNQGGSANIGLTNNAYYWIHVDTNNYVYFHTTKTSAYGNTSPVNLTTTGTETHRITKQTDTRPDMIVTGTSGSATVDGCSWLNHRNVTYTSTGTQNGGRVECKLLTQNSAHLRNLIIVTSAAPGEACLQDPTFGATDLHDVNFIQDSNKGSMGHAIELDTATSYTFTNITFTGYGADDSNQAALFINVASGTVTISIVGGDTPTYRLPTASTATVTITASVNFTLTNVVSGSTFTLDGVYTTAVPSGSYNGTGDSIIQFTTSINSFFPSSGSVRLYNGSYYETYSYTGKSGTQLTGVSPTLSQDFSGSKALIEMVSPTTITSDPYTVGVPSSHDFEAMLANQATTRYVPIQFADNTGSGFSRRIVQLEE